MQILCYALPYGCKVLQGKPVQSLVKTVQMQGQQTMEHAQATHDTHQVLECIVDNLSGGCTVWSGTHGMPVLPGSPGMTEVLPLGAV
ncbi:hypothetical protein L798_02858 [Zootermopsis nevadensis]|uniref:Uncharacterized protein n=1 Tax=Zootermopsis nevadensis TaxID=136037 RepID=A0A067RQE7_ZOONE|nr:hypothetical protein L798_02858 [Zootermopsis nevadensis]